MICDIRVDIEAEIVEKVLKLFVKNNWYVAGLLITVLNRLLVKFT